MATDHCRERKTIKKIEEDLNSTGLSVSNIQSSIECELLSQISRKHRCTQRSLEETNHLQTEENNNEQTSITDSVWQPLVDQSTNDNHPLNTSVEQPLFDQSTNDYPSISARTLYQLNVLNRRVVNNWNYYQQPNLMPNHVRQKSQATRQPKVFTYIKNDKKRESTYENRRLTLMKKAEEINTITGCNVYLELQYKDNSTCHYFKSKKYENYEVQPKNRGQEKTAAKRKASAEEDIVNGSTDTSTQLPNKAPKLDETAMATSMEDLDEEFVDNEDEDSDVTDDSDCSICFIEEGDIVVLENDH